MNARERVFGAIAGAPIDRRPFTLLGSLYGARLTDCPLERYYSDPAAYVAGQTAFFEMFQPDILFAPFAFPVLGAAFGGTLKFFRDFPPHLRRPGLADPRRLDDLKLPDIHTNPQLLYFREAVRGLKRAFGATHPIAAPALGPIDLPIMVCGLEAWLELFLFDAAAYQALLERLVTFFVDWCNALLADGADCLLFPSVFLSPAMVDRGMVQEKALPGFISAIQQVKGPVFLHHAGGPLLSFLEMYQALPANVLGFVVGERESLTEARRIIKPGLTLFGGLDGPSLHTRTPEQIFERTRGILLERSNDRHFLFTTTSSDISWATPPENLHAIRRAVCESETSS
jgi:uroporphyrinogen decarboxylase